LPDVTLQLKALINDLCDIMNAEFRSIGRTKTQLTETAQRGQPACHACRRVVSRKESEVLVDHAV
jgi:hypothetical protein